jgi:ribosomal protein S18 acetylase RimI-like enzyme
MHIRPGLATDIDAITRIELSAGNSFAGTHMSWAVGEATDSRELVLAASQGMLWIAESDHVAAGFLLACELDSNFHIREMAVDQAHQRSGIGRTLITEVLTDASSNGYIAATLTTDRTLPWNAAWYRRLGFEVIPDENLHGALAATLAAEPNSHLRCAMRKLLM